MELEWTLSNALVGLPVVKGRRLWAFRDARAPSEERLESRALRETNEGSLSLNVERQIPRTRRQALEGSFLRHHETERQGAAGHAWRQVDARGLDEERRRLRALSNA